jgi:hypothetical protein
MFRRLLIWHSSYFAAALDTSNDLLGGTDNTFELEEEIEVFDAFYCWLYTGRLKDPFVLKEHTAPEPVSSNDVYLGAISVCKIWVFADFRGIPALGNAAIDMLHEKIAAAWLRPNIVIKYVYENTTKESKLRDFLVYFYTNGLSLDELLQIKPERFTVEFMLELLPIFAKMKDSSKSMTQKRWTQTNRCKWHDHFGPGGKRRLESRMYGTVLRITGGELKE